jgi:hypothetical protein
MFRAINAHLLEITLYTCSIWYRHSLRAVVVACRYTDWVRTENWFSSHSICVPNNNLWIKLVINIYLNHDTRSKKLQVIKSLTQICSCSDSNGWCKLWIFYVIRCRVIAGILQHNRMNADDLASMLLLKVTSNIPAWVWMKTMNDFSLPLFALIGLFSRISQSGILTLCCWQLHVCETSSASGCFLNECLSIIPVHYVKPLCFQVLALFLS